MNQTRFYIVEKRNRVAQVDLLIGGLPVQLSTEEYTELLQEHLAIKSQFNILVYSLNCFLFFSFSGEVFTSFLSQ